MAEIKLHIATSIDGYIAREDGSLDWLNNHPNPDQLDYGYSDFLTEIDTIVMGRKTYEEVLGFGIEWPYLNCNTLILTSNKNYQVQTGNTKIINEVDRKTIAGLKAESIKNIWIVGGGQVIAAFLNLAAIDELLLFIIPVILGKGIRLFPKPVIESHYKLVESGAYENGVVSLIYKLHRHG